MPAIKNIPKYLLLLLLLPHHKVASAKVEKSQTLLYSEEAKYRLVKGSKDRCGCPKNQKVMKSLDEEALGEIQAQACSPYLKPALRELELKGDIRSCESFVLSNSRHRRLRHISIEHGPGMDCPSGCIYDSKNFLYDEGTGKVIKTFHQSFYSLFESIRKYRHRSEITWDEYLPSVASNFIMEKYPDNRWRQFIRGPSVRCRPYSSEPIKAYLLGHDKNYGWATDLSKLAECSVEFQESSQKPVTTYKLRFSGTIVEKGAPDVRHSPELHGLTMHIETINALDGRPR